jgi:hypothetical protein
MTKQADGNVVTVAKSLASIRFLLIHGYDRRKPVMKAPSDGVQPKLSAGLAVVILSGVLRSGGHHSSCTCWKNFSSRACSADQSPTLMDAAISAMVVSGSLDQNRPQSSSS